MSFDFSTIGWEPSAISENGRLNTIVDIPLDIYDIGTSTESILATSIQRFHETFGRNYSTQPNTIYASQTKFVKPTPAPPSDNHGLGQANPTPIPQSVKLLQANSKPKTNVSKPSLNGPVTTSAKIPPKTPPKSLPKTLPKTPPKLTLRPTTPKSQLKSPLSPLNPRRYDVPTSALKTPLRLDNTKAKTSSSNKKEEVFTQESIDPLIFKFVGDDDGVMLTIQSEANIILPNYYTPNWGSNHSVSIAEHPFANGVFGQTFEARYYPTRYKDVVLPTVVKRQRIVKSAPTETALVIISVYNQLDAYLSLNKNTVNMFTNFFKDLQIKTRSDLLMKDTTQILQSLEKQLTDIIDIQTQYMDNKLVRDIRTTYGPSKPFLVIGSNLCRININDGILEYSKENVFATLYNAKNDLYSKYPNIINEYEYMLRRYRRKDPNIVYVNDSILHMSIHDIYNLLLSGSYVGIPNFLVNLFMRTYVEMMNKSSNTSEFKHPVLESSILFLWIKLIIFYQHNIRYTQQIAMALSNMISDYKINTIWQDVILGWIVTQINDYHISPIFPIYRDVGISYPPYVYDNILTRNISAYNKMLNTLDKTQLSILMQKLDFTLYEFYESDIVTNLPIGYSELYDMFREREIKDVDKSSENQKYYLKYGYTIVNFLTNPQTFSAFKDIKNSNDPLEARIEKWVSTLYGGLSILSQVFLGLLAANAYAKFIHADLHPNNIMFTDTPHNYIWYEVILQASNQKYLLRIPTGNRLCKLIDFGLSEAVISNKIPIEIYDSATQCYVSNSEVNSIKLRDLKVPVWKTEVVEGPDENRSIVDAQTLFEFISYGITTDLHATLNVFYKLIAKKDPKDQTLDQLCDWYLKNFNPTTLGDNTTALNLIKDNPNIHWRSALLNLATHVYNGNRECGRKKRDLRVALPYVRRESKCNEVFDKHTILRLLISLWEFDRNGISKNTSLTYDGYIKTLNNNQSPIYTIIL